MRLRFSLFTKILLWFFVNLVVLGAVFLVFFNLQFRFAPDSPLSAASGNRMGLVARSIADEMRTAAPGERDAILRRYSTSYRVEFLLYANSGEKLAGGDTLLPAEISRQLTEMMAPPPPPWPPSPDRPFPPAEISRPMTRGPDPVFTVRTTNPTRYWAGVRFLAFEPGGARPVRATPRVTPGMAH